ncbi:MAG TPA: DUF1549 domain-containing protein, partial [Planctomycetota bacterium]|nr:DUF1549 domain-containing protein [Planctomycetota bacterium]
MLKPETCRFRSLAIAVLVAIAVHSTIAVEAADEPVARDAAAEAAWFRKEIYPVLEANCLDCHGGEGRAKAGLWLTNREAILRGGELGPAVSIEKPGESLLLRAVSHREDHLRMPPRARLPDETIAKLEEWVRRGVPWDPELEREVPAEAEEADTLVVTDEDRAFWSFQPVVRREPPAVENDDWPVSPIDSFILARLEAAGLEPNPPLEPAALLRRLYFDLIGLPPTPDEVRAFVEDPSEERYARIVDDLLASKRYGERWARHWLDVVRFAETNSFERDSVKPNAWRYRDWVIESLNEDKPYDRFVLEQLAGDELDEPTTETIIATGYYRLGPWDDEPTDPLQARYDELDDIVSTTGQAFLGLTLNCARCHDHKLDPIPQEDYYRVLAFFHNVLPTTRGGDTTQVEIDSSEDQVALDREREAREREIENLRSQLAALDQQILTSLPAETRAQIESGGGASAARHAADVLCKEELDRYQKLESELASLETRRRRNRNRRPSRALAVKEAGPVAPPTHVLVRGNAHAKGKLVEPSFPRIFGEDPPTIPAPREGASSSGRRRVFAEWVIRPDNPLTARVMVNRIWQHH